MVKRGGPVSCLVNPELGHEGDAVPAAAAFGERMVIVGGGPAGLQASLEGVRRGWDVVLLERADHLGGQFEYAFATPGKHLMERPFRALVRAVESSPVDIRLGVEADLVTICNLEPDLVLLATGSRPIRPRIPGLEQAIFAADVLGHRRPVGDRVLILGGGLVGIELAELLAVQGSEVDVVELLDEVARDMEPVSRRMTLARLAELPVTIHTGTRLVRMERGEAVVRTGDPEAEERRLGPFDSTVVAVGHRSHDPLSTVLREAGVRVELIGDARHPGQVLDATQDARRAAAIPRL
jgi:pyruvate/2-oxoglutarate dehydrogenase complex dihydrolipoamide dehydrogenase (E3) component